MKKGKQSVLLYLQEENEDKQEESVLVYLPATS